MIRRPPTLIALDEDDIESHLQRIFLSHTLATNFEKLQLADYESLVDLLMDQSPSSSISSDLDGDSDINSLNQGESSCFEHTSSRDEISASTDVISQPAPMKPCLKSPISNLHRSSLNPISSVKSRPADGSTDPPRLKVTFALSPQELELHSGRASFPLEEETVECVGENYPTSHQDTICAPMSIDSPASPQVSFLSCGVSSSPATAGVPLRDLTLASAMSYEAALAEQTVSSPSAANGIK